MEHPSRAFKPSLLIRITLLLHGLAVVALVISPLRWPFILAGLLAIHGVLTLLGLWPRSRGLGPNLDRVEDAPDGTVYLTFDDGPDPEVTPWVMDQLEAFGFRGTFFVIGEKVGTYPEIAREILARGHAIGNHSHDHAVRFAMQSVKGFERELAHAQETIHEACGVIPRYFRAPFGFRSPLLEPALCRVGLDLVSWTRRGYDTRARSREIVLDRLLRHLASGDILLLHDGSSEGLPPALRMIYSVLPDLLQTLKDQGYRSEALPDPYQP